MNPVEVSFKGQNRTNVVQLITMFNMKGRSCSPQFVCSSFNDFSRTYTRQYLQNCSLTGFLASQVLVLCDSTDGSFRQLDTERHRPEGREHSLSRLLYVQLVSLIFKD